MSKPAHFRRLLLSPFRQPKTTARRQPKPLGQVVEVLEDRTVPATFVINGTNGVGDDFTPIQDVLDGITIHPTENRPIADGDTIQLSGFFDWRAGTPGNTAWANFGYALFVPAGLNNITFTASGLNAAEIRGPGDVAGVDSEGVLFFDGTGSNENWTISNLQLIDFDVAIGMYPDVGPASYSGTTITNNQIGVATDINDNDLFFGNNSNVGIIYGPGINQTISNNDIFFAGDGDTTAGSQGSAGIQSIPFGPGAYDNLMITGNTFTVTGTPSANPEPIVGIWENGIDHASDITISGNTFTGSGKPSDETAFLITSHSSTTSTVEYTNNVVNGANIAFEWSTIDSPDFSGNEPVVITGNVVTNTGTGVLVQSGGTATVTDNNIAATTFVDNTGGSGTVDASFNHWGGGNNPDTIALGMKGLVDFTPIIGKSTDADGGSPGWQGDRSELLVHAVGEQVGSTGRLQEGVNAVTAGGQLAVFGVSGKDDFTVARNAIQAEVTWNGEGPVLVNGLGKLILIGNDGDDFFDIAPPQSGAIGKVEILGGDPTVAPGDSLLLNLAGVTNPNLTGGVPNGSVTATGFGNVNWFEIESLGNAFVGDALFDMQPSLGQPVQPGYIPVIPSTTYNPLNAYGWTKAPPRGYDGGTVGAVNGSPIADLLRDGVDGFSGAANAATFRVDLANPDPVQVDALIGDRFSSRDGIVVSVSSDGANFTPITPSGGTSIVRDQFTAITGTATPGLDTSGGVTVHPLWVRIADLGGTIPNWALAGLNIRTDLQIDTLTVVSPGGTLEADGKTADTYTISGTTAGQVLTISSTLGTVDATDARPEILGTQIIATGTSETFDIIRPGSSGTATITVREFTGSAFGTGTQDFSLPTLRQFDMGPANQTLPGSGDWLPVRAATNFTAALGYGWASTSQRDLTRGTFPPGSTADEQALFRDFVYNWGTGVFRVFVGVGQSATAKVYAYDPFTNTTNMNVSIPGGDSTTMGTATMVEVTGTGDANGYLDITVSNGGAWIINAIEVTLN